MCGRTAFTLAPDEICKACSRRSPNQNGNLKQPIWIDHPGNKTFTPSVNIAPSCYTPVLFGASMKAGAKRDYDGVPKTNSADDYSIMPMRWGLIPSFFKGVSTGEFIFKTNNCRIEGIDEKKMYKPSLIKGQRCVVLCNGFYEWQTTDLKKKQPFFIHAPQRNGVEIWNKEALPVSEIWSEVDGWKGPQLLMMAGLYSRWISSEGEEIYSYTVITMESGDNFSWLHHRVPAILQTFDDVDNWLKSGSYNDKISQLTTKVNLGWYKVSNLVNNSRNQDPSIINPIKNEEKKAEKTKSQQFMSSWLTGLPKKAQFEPNTSKRGESEGIKKFFKWEEKKKTEKTRVQKLRSDWQKSFPENTACEPCINQRNLEI